MPHISRRHFLKAGVAAGALAGMGSSPLFAERASATDWVTLGKSGVKVTRLAFGTGTFSGRQRQLGQEGFTRLVRYAYDRGIRFFETAESYGESQKMLGVALKGLPRDSYKLMTKVTTTSDYRTPRRNSTSCARTATPNTSTSCCSTCRPAQPGPRQRPLAGRDPRGGTPADDCDARRFGARLPALRQVPGNKWLDVAMIRVNHKGVHMDNDGDQWNVPGNVAEVVAHVHEARAAGMGVISMKLVGEGAFTQRATASSRCASPSALRAWIA